MQSAKKLFLPSLMSVTVGALLGAAILLFSNLGTLTSSLIPPQENTDLSQATSHYKDLVLGKLDQAPALANVTNALIWASVGAVVYMILWAGINLTIAFRNEVSLSTAYTTVDKHGPVTHFAELSSRALFRACAILLMCLLTIISVQFWYPLSVIMVKAWVNGWGHLFNWWLLLAGWLGWILIFHIYVVLLRLALLRTRIIESLPEAD